MFHFFNQKVVDFGLAPLRSHLSHLDLTAQDKGTRRQAGKSITRLHGYYPSPAHTGMAEHIEARSLAELNYLAANPPQYPTNPAEKKQDPLVLYISRVPGTRGKIATAHTHPRNLLSAMLTSMQTLSSRLSSLTSRTSRQRMSPARYIMCTLTARRTSCLSLPNSLWPLRLLGRVRRADGLRFKENLYPQTPS